MSFKFLVKLRRSNTKWSKMTHIGSIPICSNKSVVSRKFECDWLLSSKTPVFFVGRSPYYNNGVFLRDFITVKFKISCLHCTDSTEGIASWSACSSIAKLADDQQPVVCVSVVRKSTTCLWPYCSGCSDREQDSKCTGLHYTAANFVQCY
jgi:hypothetical protein